eukprot:gene14296-30421_t
MGKRLLYVHSDEEKYSIEFRDDVLSTERTIRWKHIIKVNSNDEKCKFDSHFLSGWMNKLIPDNRVNLVVVNGSFSEDFFYSICNTKIYHPKISLIICTSFQTMNVKPRYALRLCCEWFTMCSWQYEEYKSAEYSGALKFEEEDIQDRYYYAGGNIRLMNDTIIKIKATLDQHLSEVDNISYLLSGSVGYSSESAKDSPIAIFYEGSNFVTSVLSQYVGKKLSDTCSEEIIKKCRNIMSGNQSWQGWVTELEVLGKIQLSSDFRVWNEDNTCEKWSRCDGLSIQEFWHEDDLDKNTLAVGQYLIPSKWNHGCYDGVYIVESKKLRILQITRGQSHSSYKMDLLVPLLHKTGAQEIKFVFICKRNNFSKIRRPTAKQMRGYDNLKKSITIFLNKVCYEAPADWTVS